MGTLEIWLTLIGMTLITIVTRGFFSLPRRDIPMPGWLRDALRYAPLAALVAVVAPEVLLDHGQLIHGWQSPRLWGAVAAAGWFAWRRDILGTIVCGTAVMLALRLGLGWGGLISPRWRPARGGWGAGSRRGRSSRPRPAAHAAG